MHGLTLGEAVKTTVVVVAHDRCTFAAARHDLSVVASVSYCARCILNWDVVQLCSAAHRSGRDGRGRGRGGR